MDGNVVLREAGAVWTTIVFDTLGDSMPGGVVLDERVDRVSGPHPLLEMDEAAFCDMVQDLIGWARHPGVRAGRHHRPAAVASPA
jgi:hypothetical protein